MGMACLPRRASCGCNENAVERLPPLLHATPRTSLGGTVNDRRRITRGLLILGCSLALGCNDPVGTGGVTAPIFPQATVPQQLATDAFNRPNENPIAGNGSSVAGANLELLNNADRAASPSLGTNGVAFYNALTWPGDQWSEVTIATLPTETTGGMGDNGPAVRIAANAPTYYLAAAFANGSLELYRAINNNFARLLVAGTVATGDRVRLEVEGTTLRVYRNGVLLGSVVDTQIATGSAGLGQDGASGAMGDWPGGGFAPAPPPAPPTAPTTLAATAVSPSQINLSWTDNATTEDGFRIERCAGAGCSAFVEIATVGANVVTYQNTGLTASTSYSYRVRAYNAGGTSSYTNTATATTPTAPPTVGPLASDAFNRPNENPIAGNWSSVAAANLQLLNNAVRAASSSLGTNGVAFYNALTWPADQWSEVTIATLPTEIGGGMGDNGPVVRIAANAATYYLAAAFANGSLELYRAIDNNFSQLLVAGTVATGDRLRLEVEGTTLRVYRNGVLLGRVPDAQMATGSAGLGQDGASGAMDDWAGGGFAPAPAPAPPTAPTTLAAAAVSPSQINLSWTDNATTEDGFRIERCAGAGCSAFVEIATV